MNTLAVTLAHLFYPRHSNNQRAKLLHSSSLFVLALFLIIYQIVLQYLPLTGIRILGYAANIPPEKIIALTNEKRTEAGLSPLSYSEVLTKAAKAKGEHMLANDYWAHVAPDGTEPWAFFIREGYSYRYAGENLARDFTNPESAIEAWLASPSHKENMLSLKYKEIGVAVVEGDLAGVETTIIVSLFGTPLDKTESQVPVALAKPQTRITPAPATGEGTTVVSPTPTTFEEPSSTPTPNQSYVAVSSPQKPRGVGVLISPFDTTRGVSLATIFLLLGVMIVDGIVASKKKIPRLTGRTFAHLAFLAAVATLVFVARAGDIL